MQHRAERSGEPNRRMYELEYPAPSVDLGNESSGKGPTMIVALHGYADAGQAVEASADHLKAALENHPLASFNTDELIDYRSRRPATTISIDQPIEIEDFDLDVRVLRDNSGKSFLLLSGPEPDLRWKAFSHAVTDLVKKFNVEETIMVYAAPTPSPHTRPMVISAHGNSSKLVDPMFRFDQTVMVPGSAQLYIEKELASQGRNVAGYTAHVPHYLAASAYPQATYSLLDSVSQVTGLHIPLKSIANEVTSFTEQVQQQLSDSEEIRTVVAQLEEQYDSYLERYRQEHPQAILPGETTIPSGEEISADFERFLEAVNHEGSWRELLLHQDIDDLEDKIVDGLDNKGLNTNGLNTDGMDTDGGQPSDEDKPGGEEPPSH